MSHKKFAALLSSSETEKKPTAFVFIALDVTPRPSSASRAEERAVRWTR
jgi:hypothetical protein